MEPITVSQFALFIGGASALHAVPVAAAALLLGFFARRAPAPRTYWQGAILATVACALVSAITITAISVAQPDQPVDLAFFDGMVGGWTVGAIGLVAAWRTAHQDASRRR